MIDGGGRGQRAEVRGQRAGGGCMEIRSAKDLIVYQKAYQVAMAVFEGSEGFLSEEGCRTGGSVD